MPSESRLRGRAALLKERIPKLDVSKGGNFVMRWNDGMKLSELLSYVGMSNYDDRE